MPDSCLLCDKIEDVLPLKRKQTSQKKKQECPYLCEILNLPLIPYEIEFLNASFCHNCYLKVCESKNLLRQLENLQKLIVKYRTEVEEKLTDSFELQQSWKSKVNEKPGEACNTTWMLREDLIKKLQLVPNENRTSSKESTRIYDSTYPGATEENNESNGQPEAEHLQCEPKLFPVPVILSVASTNNFEDVEIKEEPKDVDENEEHWSESNHSDNGKDSDFEPEEADILPQKLSFTSTIASRTRRSTRNRASIDPLGVTTVETKIFGNENGENSLTETEEEDNDDDGSDYEMMMCTKSKKKLPAKRKKSTPPQTQQRIKKWSSKATNPRGPYTIQCTEENCTQKFPDEFMRTVHIKKVHLGDRKPYECEDCGKKYCSGQKFKLHKALHIPENEESRSFICEYCGKAFRFDAYLKDHIKIHTQDKKHKCPTCDKGFRTKSKLERHSTVHTGEKPFSCPTCGINWDSKTTLLLHQKSHEENSLINPLQCAKPGCDKLFDDVASLQIHADEVHKRKYICEVCGAVKTSQGNLTRHMKDHKDPEFSCDICNRKFKLLCYVETHKRYMHDGEKPYKCTLCNKKFAQSYKLTLHKQTHDGEKIHPCPIPGCGVKFKLKHYIYNHVKLVHKEGGKAQNATNRKKRAPSNKVKREIAAMNNMAENVTTAGMESQIVSEDLSNKKRKDTVETSEHPNNTGAESHPSVIHSPETSSSHNPLYHHHHPPPSHPHVNHHSHQPHPHSVLLPQPPPPTFSYPGFNFNSTLTYPYPGNREAYPPHPSGGLNMEFQPFS